MSYFYSVWIPYIEPSVMFERAIFRASPGASPADAGSPPGAASRRRGCRGRCGVQVVRGTLKHRYISFDFHADLDSVTTPETAGNPQTPKIEDLSEMTCFCFALSPPSPL